MAARCQARGFSALAFVAICILVEGCSSSSEILYQAPDSVVVGPRVALLPVVLESSLDDSATRVGSNDHRKYRYELAIAASDHLSDALGFEVVCLSYACARVPGNPWEQDQLEAWAAEISGWSAARDEPQALPPGLAAITRQLGTAFDVNQVILIHGTVDYQRGLQLGNTADLAVDAFLAENGDRLWASQAQLRNPFGWWPIDTSILFYGFEGANP